MVYLIIKSSRFINDKAYYLLNRRPNRQRNRPRNYDKPSKAIYNHIFWGSSSIGSSFIGRIKNRMNNIRTSYYV